MNISFFCVILCRKAALELEKVRAQRIAKLPVPEDPLRDLQTKPSKCTSSFCNSFFFVKSSL